MLALAGVPRQVPISLTQIAESEGISLAYLEQLMVSLRRRGLVESFRGARGGYLLAQPPDRVTLGDVLRAADEYMAPVDCLSENPKGTCCDRESACNVRPAWAKLRDSMIGVLDSTTLADLTGSDRPCSPLAGRQKLAVPQEESVE